MVTSVLPSGLTATPSGPMPLATAAGLGGERPAHPDVVLGHRALVRVCYVDAAAIGAHRDPCADPYRSPPSPESWASVPRPPHVVLGHRVGHEVGDIHALAVRTDRHTNRIAPAATVAGVSGANGPPVAPNCETLFEPALAMTGSACPVAIAPRGTRSVTVASLKRVGVAFDGSEEARGALEMGRALARAAGAELRVISVFEPLTLGALATGRTGGASVNALLRAELREALDEALADRADSPATEGRFRRGLCGRAPHRREQRTRPSRDGFSPLRPAGRCASRRHDALADAQRGLSGLAPPRARGTSSGSRA